jgi:hypothetical protein
MAWATCSVPFAWEVKGIWSQHNKVGDVSLTDVCTKHKATAVAMDVHKTNMVALFGYPCVGKAADRQMYPGHACRVACLRWTDDSKYLISVGSLDQAVFQWRVIEDAACTNVAAVRMPPSEQHMMEPRQTMQIITRAD